MTDLEQGITGDMETTAITVRGAREHNLQNVQSLFGLFKGSDTTEEAIAAARREAWENFPREDF